MKQLLDAHRQFLSLSNCSAFTLPSSTQWHLLCCIIQTQQIHKYPQFSWLEFHRSPCKRQVFSEMVAVPEFGSSHPGLPPALGALAVGGRLARAVLGGGHQESPGSSQGGSTCSNFYDLYGGESFRVFSIRCPLSSPFLLTLLYGLLPSPFFMFVTNTYHRYSYLFCCCCC